MKWFRPQSIVAGKDALTEYKSAVERVKNFEQKFKEVAKLKGYNEDLKHIETAVMDIRYALNGKGVAVVNEKKAKQLAKKVTHAIKSPKASSKHATAPQADDGDDNVQGVAKAKKGSKKGQKKSR